MANMASGKYPTAIVMLEICTPQCSHKELKILFNAQQVAPANYSAVHTAHITRVNCSEEQLHGYFFT